MTVDRPPMGWNSWNTFGPGVNEKLIKETCDLMVSSGLRDAGYEYVVIDDLWSLKERDPETGRLVPDPSKFPGGMKTLSDYVHSKGMKLGIYSCAGTMTCGSQPGSYEYEFTDARCFAEWGIDFLKYDYCYKPAFEWGELLYRRMGLALANSGRDILFSACSWGDDGTSSWINTTGAHMWRSTHDLLDSWELLKKRISEQLKMLSSGGQNCFNDMDMLIAGMNGKGHVGVCACTPVQYRTHFAFWALCGAPLFIGCDISACGDETLNLLKNAVLISINQDRACCRPFTIGGFRNCRTGTDEQRFVLARFLDNGDIAVGMFNLSDERCRMFFHLSELGLSRVCGVKLTMTDCFSGQELSSGCGQFVQDIGAGDCRVYRCRIAQE
ncbi:MAG: glycoside hydrolase family 27 protein [Clostridia bacterium]|nr:glycoside hydrolase family 27 protein [Clostridia bacterium]